LLAAGRGGGGADNGGTAGNAGSVSGAGGNAECKTIPGQCTETTYSSTTNTTQTISYFYDDLGVLIRTEDDSKPAAIVRFSYDTAGRLIESKSDACYDLQGSLLEENDKSNLPMVISGCTKYTYSNDGLRQSSSYYRWCSGDVHEYITYEYDAARHLVAEHNFGSDPAGPSVDVVYTFDAAGQVTKKTQVDATQNVTATTTYTRDAAGQPLVEEYSDSTTDDFRVTYTYDAQGHALTRRIVSVEGATMGEERLCWVSTYDDCGNQLTLDFDWECNGTRVTKTNWSYACFEG
jgi:YD repeat-containing protein